MIKIFKYIFLIALIALIALRFYPKSKEQDLIIEYCNLSKRCDWNWIQEHLQYVPSSLTSTIKFSYLNLLNGEKIVLLDDSQDMVRSSIGFYEHPQIHKPALLYGEISSLYKASPNNRRRKLEGYFSIPTFSQLIQRQKLNEKQTLTLLLQLLLEQKTAFCAVKSKAELLSCIESGIENKEGQKYVEEKSKIMATLGDSPKGNYYIWVNGKHKIWDLNLQVKGNKLLHFSSEALPNLQLDY